MRKARKGKYFAKGTGQYFLFHELTYETGTHFSRKGNITKTYQVSGMFVLRLKWDLRVLQLLHLGSGRSFSSHDKWDWDQSQLIIHG